MRDAINCSDGVVFAIPGFWIRWLPLLGDTTLSPGERRKLGFVFLNGEESANTLREAGKFYLWEGRFVGEAAVIP
jgi:hypothetical protein